MRGYSQSHTFGVGPTMKKIPHAVSSHRRAHFSRQKNIRRDEQLDSTSIFKKHQLGFEHIFIVPQRDANWCPLLQASLYYTSLFISDHFRIDFILLPAHVILLVGIAQAGPTSLGSFCRKSPNIS